MKICMYTSEFPPDVGGISTYVYNLSKRLVERGHNVTVITRGNWRKTYCEEIEGISVYRVRFVPFFPSPFKIHQLYINKLLKSLKFNFDLIHLHGTLIPVKPVFNNSWNVIFTSHGASKKKLDHMETKTLHFFIVKLLRKRLFKIEQEIVEKSDVLTAVSNSCADDLRIYHPLKKEITIVHNGVDTNFFRPSENRSNLRYVLYTGRFEVFKGLSDLIECSSIVCKKYPDVKFILVGSGTILDNLKKQVNKLKLEDNFVFTGSLSKSQIIEYYQNATIFVLPSYREGFPTSLMEAMSCGIPSIATNVEGSFELIKESENGLLVPPKNPEKLAESIIYLLENEEFRYRIGHSARDHIVKNYDWETITDGFEKLYDQLLH
ncbi:glycosyltransferase [Methanosarcina sp. 1.H.T.1A.1]|uniref:glycosyltransferase family 4 protein n=1 Tax=Methanosarcina sp. 1.H.T.1A.1 TaxID=1483602 RepID=UPI0006214781|nr:glycosyltransferase family 4 protein [Methanosarcina sp. 1.H.T.1A.1]KKH99305.1 glycosyltransferase [Methanosarcina sp. 1.H.T.1A.1]